MSDVILREQLLASFQDLQDGFKASLLDAKNLDGQFRKAQKHFSVRMASHIRQAKQRLPENNPLNAQIDGILSAIADTDKAWQHNLACYDKGLSFRQDFEDSLLVFVFGKVKSGKSSLGNYMAWGHTDPSRELKESMSTARMPAYFTAENTHASNGDADGEVEARREFRVGATEATSSIQGFRLPGLTWVDSPGLHSVNGINGELAKEYVKHADLILYTMRSDSPGRASDMNEIKSLNAKGKQILILVTGSDFNDENWDDELGDLVVKVQMKTPENRLQQRQYIASELDGVQTDVILSISTRYAQEHANDPDEMNNSGLSELFKVLHSISLNHGVQLKREVPMRNFSLFLDECAEQLVPYQGLINNLDDEVKRLEKQIPKRMIQHSRNAQQTMRDMINEAFDSLEVHRNDEGKFNAELRKATRAWNDGLQTAIGKALENGLADISHELKEAADKTWYTSSLKLPEFSIEKVVETIPSGFVSGTRNRNSGIGGLLGTVVGGGLGFMVGGPAGAAAGASIGGGLGGMAGGAFGSDAQNLMETIELNVGDNLEAMKKQVTDSYVQVVKNKIEEHSTKSLSSALAETREVIRALATELREMHECVHTHKAHAIEKLKYKRI